MSQVNACHDITLACCQDIKLQETTALALDRSFETFFSFIVSQHQGLTMFYSIIFNLYSLRAANSSVHYYSCILMIDIDYYRLSSISAYHLVGIHGTFFLVLFLFSTLGPNKTYQIHFHLFLGCLHKT